MRPLIFSLLFCVLIGYGIARKNNLTIFGNVFDLNLFKSVVNPAMCKKQIDYLLHNNTLLLAEFLDAGIRMPKGVLTGNLVDLGNYYQCLGIHEEIKDFAIDGKYCLIEVPLDQSELRMPIILPLSELPDRHKKMPNPNNLHVSGRTAGLLKKLDQLGTSVNKDNNINRISGSALSGISFTMAVCIPKVCSTQQALDGLSYSMATTAGFKYKDIYCRLPNDKPWLTVDYVALGVFLTIGFLTLLSTAYDLHHIVFRGKDPKQANPIYQSFSMYTNTKRLVTYTSVPGTLECLDGIRALAMIWIIAAHSFMLNLWVDIANPLDIYEYASSLKCMWFPSAPMSVDTFFMLGGLLLVYTVTNKLTRRNLVRRLHLFYLLRILRMTPVLAAVVLFQASLLNHVADGPNWYVTAAGIEDCRQNWWTTLLYVQNYANPVQMCLPHSWYLAIDMQLHLLSPLVLFWILGREKRTVSVALTVTILLAIIPASIYNALMQFPGTAATLGRLENHESYMTNYYVNTFTRCSPYIVGMIYGYLLHLHRETKVVLPKIFVTVSWLCAIILTSIIVYTSHLMKQSDWDNRTMDNVACSLMRPVWAVAIGWMAFACVQGYGGPVNWLLSLRLWKLISRLSYAMYIVHYLIITIMYSSMIAPIHMMPQSHMSRFIAQFLLTLFAAFSLTVIVDAPCTVLVKHLIGEGAKKPQQSDEPAMQSHPKQEARSISVHSRL